MTDQPTAGVALDFKIVADAMAEMQGRIEMMLSARQSQYDAAVAIAKGYARTPASGPVEADDRLAVAVEALRYTEAQLWERPARSDVTLVRLRIRKAIALLTSGEAGE